MGSNGWITQRISHRLTVHLEDLVLMDRRRERAQKAVPVIRQLAEILNAYRISMGNPMDFKLAQRVIRPLVKSIEMEWYGLASVPAWHCFEFV